MDPKLWSVVIYSPNKFLSKLQFDLFRDAHAKSIQVAANGKDTLAFAKDYSANVVVVDLSEGVEECLELVKSIRRPADSPAKKAFIFGVSTRMTLSLVEKCRIAGVNAAVGLPLSRTSLIQTVQKVLSKPRPFIEVESYTGPCRRAGIVSVNAVENRRRATERVESQLPDTTLNTA